MLIKKQASYTYPSDLFIHLARKRHFLAMTRSWRERSAMGILCLRPPPGLTESTLFKNPRRQKPLICY